MFVLNVKGKEREEDYDGGHWGGRHALKQVGGV